MSIRSCATYLKRRYPGWFKTRASAKNHIVWSLARYEQHNCNPPVFLIINERKFICEGRLWNLTEADWEVLSSMAMQKLLETS